MRLSSQEDIAYSLAGNLFHRKVSRNIRYKFQSEGIAALALQSIVGRERLRSPDSVNKNSCGTL